MAAAVYATGHALGFVAAACLLGGMVFFAAVLAPVVFTTLDGPTAARFVRALFPWYYLYVFVAAAIAALGLSGRDGPGALALLFVALVTVWLRQGLMQRINLLRDAGLAGDPAALAGFNRAHRLSVAVNMVQLVVVLIVTVRAGL